jgi:hypothetical protein
VLEGTPRSRFAPPIRRWSPLSGCRNRQSLIMRQLCRAAPRGDDHRLDQPGRYSERRIADAALPRAAGIPVV